MGDVKMGTNLAPGEEDYDVKCMQQQKLQT